MPQPPPLQFPDGYAPRRPQQPPSDVPIPTTRAPPHRMASTGGNNLRRAKTLVRPERGVAPAPLINPPAAPLITSAGGVLPSNTKSKSPADSWDAWRIFSHIVTFWAPPFLLSTIGRMKDKPTRQAWREKIALCFLALLLGGTVGFATMGLDRVLCPDQKGIQGSQYARVNTSDSGGTISVNGWMFNISNAATEPINFFTLSKPFSGVDVTPNFTRKATDFPSCAGLSFKAAKDDPCGGAAATTCKLGDINNATFNNLKIVNKTVQVGYDWDQVARLKYHLVLDGFVLNMAPYFAQNPTPVANDPIDKALRHVLFNAKTSGGKDATLHFSNQKVTLDAVPCLNQRYFAGNIDRTSSGCFIASLFLYVSLLIIMGVVMARFIMACVFSWFISRSLVAPPKNLSRKAISPSVMPEGANVTVDNQNGTAPWAKKGKMTKNPTMKGKPQRAGPNSTGPVISLATIGQELFCVCLVTCYSEGRNSIKGTLDSIALTTYSDNRKLLFIVCDGMITGAGEKQSTPDICVGMLDADPRFGNPAPMSYVAVGLGSKKENRAMVYAGHYVVGKHRTPTIIVVKCGTESEAANDKKPGNRGKRDSQLVLMNFFSRVTYNDRMSPLDYDLFRKMQVLMGVTPDFFEVSLMVDADTIVAPDSLTQLVNCMHHDSYIMGVCGETRIANKRQSWVTAIQVYEYFISHHLAKAFESVFGGVTCLPGCFSMYRLKARKANDEDWVPLITKPEIVREYSQSEVTTLHQKNLLLLGEDRFLTTILLRTFPNRKMMFSLPIWNFVLPVYSFWHFDDFSWGETRRVEGEGKQKGHDIGSATLADGTQVPLRRWEDWERSRIRKLKREAQRKREMERNFPGGARSVRGPEQYSMAFSEFADDSTSLAPSEDDRWGAQIGGYNESSTQWAPPPIALLPEGELLHNAETVGGDELQAILERGFDDHPHRDNRDSSTTMSSTGPIFANQSRFQLSDQGVMMPPPPSGRFDSYAPLSTRTPSPGPAVTSFGDIQSPLSPTGGASSAVEFQTHVKKRSNGGRLRNDSEELLRHTPGTSPSSPQTDWGPMGPLDPQFTQQNNSRPYASTGRRI
ncbi:hypothetical protein FRC14_004569 [Serendipita sp. 396]|nr:hypothetical protein FRC14_004569 [Serendipita sp. 396]KAG8866563.1 hypothetical protein FRC20_008146 [Serendipita sp. 405]